MAGPEEAAQQAARMAEEADMKRRRGGNGRVRRPKDTDNDDNFAAQAQSIRNADDMYRNRQTIMDEIRQLFKDRGTYLRDVSKYEARYDEAEKGLKQSWTSFDGRVYSMTYDEYLDYVAYNVQSDEDKEYAKNIKVMLDKHPSAISAAEKAGFSFVTEDEFKPNDPVGNTQRLQDKGKKLAFLQSVVNSYNEGTYTPYYDRDIAYNTIREHHDNPNIPFSALKRSKDSRFDRDVFQAEAEKYGVDARTIESWYRDADKVILSYERDDILDPEWNPNEGHRRIDVDYSTLFALSGGCAKTQAQMNQDGVHVGSIFDAIKKSADAYHQCNDAMNGVKRSAQNVDMCDAQIEQKRAQINMTRDQISKEFENRVDIGSGLRSMYDAEMGRYRNGFTQQPPLMWDMAKRWARGKTRFLDGRREAKEQMRDQKWSAKTGINERGIKTEGSLADFFKSLVRECRRQLYVSGATDFSLVGETDRLLVALGMEGTRKAFDKTRMGIMNLEDKLMDRKLDKKRQGVDSGILNDAEMAEGTDVANYTKSIQLASEASTGRKFTGDEAAANDYDGRDNNPADVMAGWDEQNEKFQHLLDEKGYHTDNNDDLDHDGPDDPDGPDID